MDVSHSINYSSAFRLSDPVLRYRLDPCEPGMLKSAPASQSIAAVSAHERGNLNQFRREATLAGRMVISSSITFTRAIDGLFPSIRAGRTEVVSVPLPQDNTESPSIESPLVEIPQLVDAEEDAISGDELELLAILSAISRRLESDLLLDEGGWSETAYATEPDVPTRIDIPTIPEEEAEPGEDIHILGSDRISEDDAAPFASPASIGVEEPEWNEDVTLLRFEDVRIREEIRELRHKLHELQMKRLSANISQLNEILTGAIQKNIDLATNLIQVANRIGPNSHFPDLSGSIPLLGATLDFSV